MILDRVRGALSRRLQLWRRKLIQQLTFWKGIREFESAQVLSEYGLTTEVIHQRGVYRNGVEGCKVGRSKVFAPLSALSPIDPVQLGTVDSAHVTRSPSTPEEGAFGMLVAAVLTEDKLEGNSAYADEEGKRTSDPLSLCYKMKHGVTVEVILESLSRGASIMVHFNGLFLENMTGLRTVAVEDEFTLEFLPSGDKRYFTVSGKSTSKRVTSFMEYTGIVMCVDGGVYVNLFKTFENNINNAPEGFGVPEELVRVDAAAGPPATQPADPPTAAEESEEESEDFDCDGGGLDSVGIDNEQPPAGADADAGLSVGSTKEDESSLDRRRSNLGDLEISSLEDAETVGRKRTKKRRKIVIDNNATELSSEHMKNMLRDTSDIVLQGVQSLAAWPRDDVEEEEGEGYQGICPALQRLPTERLLARPCIGDDGGLAPELLELWGRNMCKITGKPGTQLPFRMRGEEQRGAVAEKLMEEEAAGEEDGDQPGADLEDNEGEDNGREIVASRVELVRGGSGSSCTSDRRYQTDEDDSIRIHSPGPDFGGGGDVDIDFDDGDLAAAGADDAGADDAGADDAGADDKARLSVDSTKDDESSLDRCRSNLSLPILDLEDASNSGSEGSKKKKRTRAETRSSKDIQKQPSNAAASTFRAPLRKQPKRKVKASLSSQQPSAPTAEESSNEASTVRPANESAPSTAANSKKGTRAKRSVSMLGDSYKAMREHRRLYMYYRKRNKEWFPDVRAMLGLNEGIPPIPSCVDAFGNDSDRGVTRLRDCFQTQRNIGIYDLKSFRKENKAGKFGKRYRA